MIKVIIAGGRDFKDFELLKSHCNRYLKEFNNSEDIEIVSGGANGADTLGEKYAKKKKYKIKQFLADWDNLGKSAGYIRNAEMAKYADILIAFWDGKSRGTKHMIDLAKKKRLVVKTIYYNHK